MNVQNSGGAAAVIYNNEPGNFLGTLGDEASASDIIAISLSQEDGQAIVALINSQPDVAIVGDIFSDFSFPDSGYEAWNGTSMATPHVSGAAALIWSAYPNKTNAEIREALTATAQDLGDPGRDNVFGYGLVQAKDALDYLGSSGGDTTAPVISDVASARLGRSGKFEVTWTTDEAATSQVRIIGLGIVNDDTLVADHSITIRGKKGVTYEYYVTSVDAAGNSATAGPFIHDN
jgi:subtilisin family serine protease